ncbi:MAG: hypothetical protein ACTSRZ_08795 [Promethearchaeota archaeon]
MKNRDGMHKKLSHKVHDNPSEESIVQEKNHFTDSFENNEDLWSYIGFHRPIAGFFYNLPFLFISLLVGIVLSSWFLQYLYPFPEAIGYKTVPIGIFALMFEAFDLGTANILNRFIGETNVKNPNKMLKYIQYFIWYQMFTGLIQVTFISVYTLFVIPNSQLGYAAWILLIYSTRQYPGMLGIFKGVIDTLQQYNKSTILSFVSGEIFQRITEIGFVLYFRYYGITHPAIGEIMGIAIGSIIGTYVDDFFAMILSAYFFQKVLKPYGFSVKDCFRIDFDIKIVKECLSWGIRSGIPSLLWGIVTYMELIFWLTYVPQYTTFKALFDVAGWFSGILGWNLSMGGAISEAYFNGKKELSRFYVGQWWKYTGLIQCLMIAVICVIVSMLHPIFIFMNLEYQLLAIPFIIPRVIREIQQPYNNISMNILANTGHVTFQMITNIVETSLSLIGWIMYIPILNLPNKYGILVVMWLLPCGELPAIITKIVLQYWYIHKNILKLKIPFYQTFIAPGISAFIYLIVGLLYSNLVFSPMNNNFGTLIALISAILFLIIFMGIFVYFPLTALLGGWDDDSLVVFRLATKISGPSKGISALLNSLLNKSAQKSKLHNKYKYDAKQAFKEIKELMELKKSIIESNKK